MIVRKMFGLLFVIAAVAGFIFSVVGLVEIWRYRPAVTQAVVDNLALLDRALTTTQDGLTIVGQAVQTTTGGVASLQTTTQALALAIHNTNPVLDSLASLTAKDIPDAVDATQTSLASAQSSALVIDNVLGVLTSIPLSPVTYKPDVPLHTSLAQVSTSLNSITPSLDTITASLADGKANLGVVEVELNNISKTTKEISTSLGSAQTVIDQYKAITTQIKARVDTTQRVAPAWMMTTTWILTFFLGWLLIAQLGLGAQGLDMLRSRREAK